MTTPPDTILIALKNRHMMGERNICVGVARALGAALDRSTTPRSDGEGPRSATVPVCSTILARRVTRPLIPMIQGAGGFRHIGPVGPARHLWSGLFRSDRVPAGAPRLVISASRKSEYACLALATYFRVPAVHVGEPRIYPPDHFALIVTSDAAPSRAGSADNRVLVETVPSHIVPEDAARQGAQLRDALSVDADTPIWACLVGGASDSYAFAEDDWRDMAALLDAAARRWGVRWLVTTSRRTWVEGERILRSRIGTAPWLLDATWWHDGTATQPWGLPAYLGAASRIAVTAESLSMVSDAVSLSKPVFALEPRSMTAEAGSIDDPLKARLSRFLTRLERARRLVRVPLSELAEAVAALEAPTDRFHVLAAAERWDHRIVERARALGLV